MFTGTGTGTGTGLTAIEQQLLHALSTGASNKHMARHMGKSEFTVRNQLSNLFKKVNVNNRTQAAGWYREYMVHKEQEDGSGTSVPLLRQQYFAKIPDKGLRKLSEFGGDDDHVKSKRIKGGVETSDEAPMIAFPDSERVAVSDDKKARSGPK